MASTVQGTLGRHPTKESPALLGCFTSWGHYSLRPCLTLNEATDESCPPSLPMRTVRAVTSVTDVTLQLGLKDYEVVLAP